jgi:hypothetical protein
VTFSADPDLWGHVRFGVDILRDRAIASTDPYSFTSDVSWVNHEWLAEVMMGFSYSTAGSVGLSVLRLALLSGSIILAADHLRRANLSPIIFDGLLALLAIGAAAQITTLRPQLWSLLLFVGLLNCICRGITPRRAVILAAMFAVWVNAHGGWIVGAGTLLLWALVELLTDRDRRHRLAGIAFLTVAPILGALLNPYGYEMFAFIYDTVELGRDRITEWQSVLVSEDRTAFVRWSVVLLFSIASLPRLRREDLPRLAVVCMFAFASLRVQRLLVFFAVSAVMLLGPRWSTLRVMGPPSSSQVWTPCRFLLAWAGTIGLVGFLLVPRLAATGCISLPNRDWFPGDDGVVALNSLGARGRIFTWFNYGEYAIWHLSPRLKVSMDGRRETVYSASVLRQHFDAYHCRQGGVEYFRQLAPDFAWLPAGLELAKHLRGEGWTVLSESDGSVVLARPGLNATGRVRSSTARACFP